MRCVRRAIRNKPRKHDDDTEMRCPEPTRLRIRVRTVTVPVEERSQNLSVVLHLMLAEATPHCFPVPTRVILHDVDPLCPEGEDLVWQAYASGLRLVHWQPNTACRLGCMRSIGHASRTRSRHRSAGASWSLAPERTRAQTRCQTRTNPGPRTALRLLQHMQLLPGQPACILRAHSDICAWSVS